MLTLGNFTYGDTPTAESIAGLLAELLGLTPTFDVSAYDLAQRHDIRQLVVQTLMTYLELEGLLEATGPFYSEVSSARCGRRVKSWPSTIRIEPRSSVRSSGSPDKGRSGSRSTCPRSPVTSGTA